MRRSCFLLLVAFLLHLPALAQQLRGRVVSAATGQPVPFASVGVKDRPIGSITDEAGRFAFATPTSLASTDSVIISCVGFRPLGLSVGQLRRAEAAWALRPAVQALREVAVRHAGLRPGRLGTRLAVSPMQWTTEDTLDVTDARGWELATLLRVRHNCFIDHFHVRFNRNEFRALRLRFTLYAVEHGRPTRLLLTDDIQLSVPAQRTGWVGLDLRRYNLHLTKGQTVAAGIQWLQGEKVSGGRQRLAGPALLPAARSRTFIRQKSEAPWEKHVASIGMYLDVQQYD